MDHRRKFQGSWWLRRAKGSSRSSCNLGKGSGKNNCPTAWGLSSLIYRKDHPVAFLVATNRQCSWLSQIHKGFSQQQCWEKVWKLESKRDSVWEFALELLKVVTVKCCQLLCLKRCLLPNFQPCSPGAPAGLIAPCHVCSSPQGGSRTHSKGSLSFLSLLSSGQERRGENNVQELPAFTSGLLLVVFP